MRFFGKGQSHLPLFALRPVSRRRTVRPPGGERPGIRRPVSLRLSGGLSGPGQPLAQAGSPASPPLCPVVLPLGDRRPLTPRFPYKNTQTGPLAGRSGAVLGVFL